MNSVFDPLVRLAKEHAPGRAPGNSLGIGLFIAKEIVLAHGGTISASSSSEAGTVFTVELPRWARVEGS